MRRSFDQDMFYGNTKVTAGYGARRYPTICRWGKTQRYSVRLHAAGEPAVATKFILYRNVPWPKSNPNRSVLLGKNPAMTLLNSWQLVERR